MSMSLGESIRTTLFGESHGAAVGALLEGIPAGTPIDEDYLKSELERRRPGSGISSLRKESDVCEILSGVHQGKATGGPILLLIRNLDSRSSDYSFLPDQPRPGHADLPAMLNSDGFADPRGGGANSARLTVGLVASASLCQALLDEHNISVIAHVAAIGKVVSDKEPSILEDDEVTQRIRCSDKKVAKDMLELVLETRKSGDSIGSRVDIEIKGLALGFGAGWYRGLEPLLAHALMAIPGARAVEFGMGTKTTQAYGSEYNSPWYLKDGEPTTDGDGALGGMATGAPLIIRLTLKPPSSIAKEQITLNLSTGEQSSLNIKGRHDPVLGPRAVPIAEATVKLVISDMLQRCTKDE